MFDQYPEDTEGEELEDTVDSGVLNTGRRTLLKAASASAGALVTGGTVLGSVTAATTSADGDCVQVDFVTGTIVNDVDTDAYADQDRLIEAQWGETINNETEGESTTRTPSSTDCDITVTSGVSIDFGAETASVSYDLTNCSGGGQDLMLVSYETPCNGAAATGGAWDPANADKQTLFDFDMVTGASSSGTLEVEVPGEDLIAYYPLDDAINGGGTAVDAANANDATISGTPLVPAPRRTFDAYDFDGSDDYIDLPGFTPGGDDSVSVAMWVNADELSGQEEFIFWGDGPPQFEFWYEGGLKFIYYDGNNGFGITDGPTLNTGQWYHLAGTYDDSTGDWALYVDGSQVAGPTDDTIGSTSTKDVGFNGDNTRIGRHPSVGRRYAGDIDEVRFYDRALSGSEVSDLASERS
jgi:hypothetical protein